MIEQFVEEAFCLNRCRLCCRFSQRESVWSPCLLDEEIAEFAKRHIPPSLISPHKKIRLLQFPKADTAGLPSHIGPIFICPFLDPEASACKIYFWRPFECKLYPFLVNRRQGKIFLAVDLGCPYIKDNLKTKRFEEYLQYLKMIFSQPILKDMLKSNPQIIQSYTEAQDLIELII